MSQEEGENPILNTDEGEQGKEQGQGEQGEQVGEQGEQGEQGQGEQGEQGEGEQGKEQGEEQGQQGEGEGEQGEEQGEGEQGEQGEGVSTKNIKEIVSSNAKSKTNIYTKMMLSKKVVLDIKSVDKNITDTLLQHINKRYAGKCIDEGYVKPTSIEIISYSSGLIKSKLIEFDVVFECAICHLVEGMEIDCIARNITKAGIKAELAIDYNPVIIFVARDHHHTFEGFNNIVEEDKITVRIIGQRYELNDTQICAIAELVV